MHLMRTSSVLEYNVLNVLVLIAIGTVAGIVLHRVLLFALRTWAKRGKSAAINAVVETISQPAAYILPLACCDVAIAAFAAHGAEAWRGWLVRAGVVLTIATLAWAAIVLIRLWSRVVVAAHRFDVEDNLLARQLGTRIGILSRTLIIITVILSVGVALMTFPSIRAIGTGLLASAGAAGLIVGLAARPLFENLIAGIQLALTEPIRLDDVVVVQGYWGRVEEIHSTYVVIRVWDLRRLVVPLSWFITNAFENWTRQTANLIGAVEFSADWRLDVEALRAKIPEMLKRSPLWDGQVQNCQVVDATDRAVQVRVLVSARNSGDLWDLRCFAREAIIGYLRDEQPQALPQVRLAHPSEDGAQQRALDGAERQDANRVQRIRTAST